MIISFGYKILMNVYWNLCSKLKVKKSMNFVRFGFNWDQGLHIGKPIYWIDQYIGFFFKYRISVSDDINIL